MDGIRPQSEGPQRRLPDFGSLRLSGPGGNSPSGRALAFLLEEEMTTLHDLLDQGASMSTSSHSFPSASVEKLDRRVFLEGTCQIAIGAAASLVGSKWG